MADKDKLTEEVQSFIVEALARFKSPTQVLRMVKEEFGVDVKRQNVRHYNPYQSKDAAEKWKKLFDDTRAAFIKDAKSIGGFHQSYRLQELAAQYAKADAAGNVVLATNILKQMAEEVGGIFTNSRKVTINPREGLAALLGCSPDELPFNSDSHA